MVEEIYKPYLEKPRGRQASEHVGIYAVSDGSVLMEHGSYGWVIASKNAEFLAVGSGPSRGTSQHSFRAEAYGMLAMLLFIIRSCEYCGLPIPERVQAYTDNEPLVKRINRKRAMKGDELANSTIDWSPHGLNG
jgi:hypothetical protein